ncbi:MAG: PAS domain S-box protein [Proteobacteria bacterium]|nr:PAS domain S-box protein [Pseudomonadota bacterium]
MPDTPQAATLSDDGMEQVVSALACHHSSVIYYLADREGTRPFNWISSNFENITGHDPQAIVDDGDFFLRHIHPDDAFEVDRRSDRLHDTGKDSREFRVRTADGGYVWLRDELRATPDDGPAGGQLFGCMSDISAEKHAEQKLTESNRECERLSRLLRDAVEGSPHGLTGRDADGSLLICNRAYSQIYGLEPDDLLGKTRSEVGLMIMRRIRQYDGIPVTDPEAEFEGWLERLETIADNPVEIELDDGRWLLASGHHTPDGGIALTRTDITKQKRVELALRESEQRFRYLLESHPLPVYIVELESGKILYESPASAKMFRHEWPSEKERYVTDYYVDPTDRAPYI